MAIGFEGRVAVVTGAGSGLGRAHALLLARLGAKVVVNDPGVSVQGTGDDRSVAQRVVDQIQASGGQALANLDSVVDPEGAARIVQSALDTYGRLDILVNNAGILRDRTLAKLDLADFRAVIDVHMYGTVNCTKAAWAVMNAQEYGRIVVTTSHSGISGSFGQSNYGAAKMAVLGLMNCLAREGIKKNVRINAIAPSAATRMTDGLVASVPDEYLRADLVSPAVAWLCSEQCEHTGLIVSAGGGYFSRFQMMETPGVQFDPRGEVTPDSVAEAFEKFGRLDHLVPVHPHPLGDLEHRLRALGLLGESKQ